MKRTISKMLGIAALAIAGIAGSFMLATPAQAVTTTITCTSYLPNTNNYPRDQAGHAQLCSRTVVNGSNTTVTTPTTSRANILFGAVSGAYAVNHSLPAVVKNRLIADNVKYFFFNSRDDADLYFNGVAPYNQIAIPVHSFKGGPGHARCANTGYGYLGIGKVIAVAVATCNHPTPDLQS
ncbi:MAG: hypothetical protein K2W82_19815 [Candidatus Obscuribacterales bacterium]|nr:hypothetical protein [Candidatus Obscuribacterales bacterium]